MFTHCARFCGTVVRTICNPLKSQSGRYKTRFSFGGVVPTSTTRTENGAEKSTSKATFLAPSFFLCCCSGTRQPLAQGLLKLVCRKNLTQTISRNFLCEKIMETVAASSSEVLVLHHSAGKNYNVPPPNPPWPPPCCRHQELNKKSNECSDHCCFSL